MTDLSMVRTTSQALAIGRGRLGNTEDPMREARLLLAHAAGLERGKLHSLEPEHFTTDLVAVYLDCVDRRADGEPLSKIIGYRDFWKHRFVVSSDVLDPRPDTEVLVEAALSCEFESVLDLGTGSGCILLSLLAERSGAQGTGTDVSTDALAVAKRNACALGVAERARFLVSDWYASVSGRFDLIASNPPYIAKTEMERLGPELSYDPRVALTDEHDGLSAFRTIVPGATAYLRQEGRLLVEIGWQQKEAVEEIFRNSGFDTIQTLKDLDGRDRVVQGTWLGKA